MAGTVVAPVDVPATIEIPATVDLGPLKTPDESERALKTTSQRRINLIWELTQMMIAIVVLVPAMALACYLAVVGMRPASTDQQQAIAVTAFMFVSSTTAGVIGFYFGRTNHTRTGGVGSTTGEGR